MNDDLTVLDYVKALLSPWRGAPPQIPPLESSEDADIGAAQTLVAPVPVEGAILDEEELTIPPVEIVKEQSTVFPWRSVIALGMALAAQISLEPGPERSWGLGAAAYAISGGFLVWANLKGEWSIPSYPAMMKKIDQMEVRWGYLSLGAVFSLLAFITMGGNQFTLFNLLLWISATTFICVGFWKPSGESFKSIWSRLVGQRSDLTWNLRISTWAFVLLLAAVVVIFFRFYQYSSVPPEMVSDHAEKLIDIQELIEGDLRIFFPRNTGREGFQMYLTALVIKLFGTGISFDSLKIGTILAGLVTLPFIYLLGVEIANKRAALFAMVFAGIAYWPNVISRVGLRFSIYPLFVAPTLYFLIRGLRRSSRNDFILAGIFLGFGLHGYTPFRIVPFVILAAVGLYLIHSQSKGFRKQTLIFLLILVVISVVVFIPLLRYWIENPEMFSYRAFTRLGSIENPLPGPAGVIFIRNLWNAMTMFFWSNGEIWPVSIPHRPALDVVSAALFFTGLVLLIVRYIRKRNWLDIFLFLSVPLLMLPSILSLAFPAENPTLNRTAGALIPVFIIIGLSIEGFIASVENRISRPINKSVVWVAGTVFLFWAGFQNFDLVFNQYERNYSQSAWNTSEIGGAIRDFSQSIGTQENAFVVAFPHWVDTRLVGINAGFPTRDFAIWPEDFDKTLNTTGSKLFIVKNDDMESLVKLQELFPEGIKQRFTSMESDKDFFQYYVLSD